MHLVPKTDELLSEVSGGKAWITLNRPKALNALSMEMVRSISALLQKWEQDTSIQAVIIQGTGDKAFCAGGDIRSLYHAHQKGDLSFCDAYFREEYTLNALLYQYPKPYVSLINGIAMGGGLGASINGSHRIVTERALLAMPETGIGFFPDVGATTFLNNAPGAVGLYLGLTGYRMQAADALWSGLGTHFMPASSLPDFTDFLRQGAPLDAALSLYNHPFQEPGFLEHHFEMIQTHFTQPSLEALMESLSADPSPFAQNTYNTLCLRSPTSLAVTFRQLKKEGPPLSFNERMKMEFRLSQRFLEGQDFMEGIRAVLIDKDHVPKWKPASIQEVKPEEIRAYFSPLEDRELKI